MKYRDIKTYNEGIVVSKDNSFEEEFSTYKNGTLYEGIKLWIGQVSNAYSIKLYINNSSDYIKIRTGEVFELYEIGVEKIRIEIGQTIDDNGSAIVNLVLFK